MARPKKEGLDYFSVDVDFDEKVESILMIHKNDGLSWVINFWQKAYKTLTGVVDFSGLFAELFANKCRITLDDHKKILSTAISVDFCYEIEPDRYTSNGIQKRISSVSKDRADAIARKKEKESSKEKEKRKEKKSIVKESKVKDCPDCSANNSRTIPEQFKSTENIDQNKNWRTSFPVYFDLVGKAVSEILMSDSWVSKQEVFNPNVDIRLSVKKAFENFWGTEAGWKHKKKSKSVEIDWYATFANAISINKVYKQRNQFVPQQYTKESFQRQMGISLE